MRRDTIKGSLNLSIEGFAEIIRYELEQVEEWCFMIGDHLPYDKRNGDILINFAEGMHWILENGIEIEGDK